MSRDTLQNEALQPSGLTEHHNTTPTEPPQLYPARPKGKGSKSPQAGGLERARKGSGGLMKVS